MVSLKNKDNLKKEADLKNEDDFKKEDNLKNEANLKKEADLKNENDLKNDFDLKNENDLKNEDNPKTKDDQNNEDDLKNEDNLQDEDDLKNWPSSKIILPPPPLKKIPEIFLMTHLDSHTTTDVTPDMLSGVQTGNGIPHDRYNIRGIAHVHTNRKDDIFMQRRLGPIFTCTLECGQGTCKKSKPYPARAYTTLVVLVLLISS